MQYPNALRPIADSKRLRKRLLAALGAAAIALGSAHTATAQAPTLSPADAAATAASAPAPRNGTRLRPGEPIPPAELEAFVDAALRIGMDETHVAGAAVSVVQGGRMVLNKGYGFASFDPPRPVDPDTTLFRIGSITKTFTWILVMRAVEAGKLELEAPVNRYLPVDLQMPDDGFEQPIRVRDLLTHSPGFEDRFAGILFIFEPERLIALEDFLRDYLPRRVRAPGTVASYSNYGTALAGAVVAAVEGAPWQDLVERDILSPLGLTHTSVREPYPERAGLPAPMAQALARDVSNGFRWNGVGHVVRDFELITQAAPAGAMSASARDIARYMLLLLGDGTLEGVTVFGAAAARAFRTPLTSLPAGVGALDAGFFDAPLPGGFRGYGHGGATTAFFSNLVVVPELGLGIFATTNTEGGGAVANALAGRIVEHFYAPPRSAPAAPARALVGTAAVYAGDYVSTRRRYAGLEGFLTRFAGAMSVNVTSEGYLLVSGLGPTQRYVPADEPDVFRPAAGPAGAGGMLRFERDGERVERVVAMPIAFERVGLAHRPVVLLLAAGLTVLTAAGIVIGAFLRLQRPPAESSGQKLARRAQLAAAVLWLVGIAAFALWITGVMADLTGVFRDWPGALLASSSSAALAATAVTVLGALLLPVAWRGAPGAPGWTLWRKGRYTVAVAIFGAFGAVLGAWGALEPWAS
jgi:CubicO group peptidase (beta-lactamase class C family)